MARKEKWKGIACHHATDRARCFWMTYLRCNPGVRPHLSRRNARGGAERGLLELGEVADVDERVVDRPGIEEPLERVHEPGWRLAAQDAPVQPPFGTDDDILDRFARVEGNVCDSARLESDVKPADRRRHRREHDGRIQLALDRRDVSN